MLPMLNQGAKSIGKSKGIIKYITNKWTVQGGCPSCHLLLTIQGVRRALNWTHAEWNCLIGEVKEPKALFKLVIRDL